MYIGTYNVKANFSIQNCLFQGDSDSIWIRTTTANFTIRDCIFDGGDTAIYLSGTFLGNILNNTIRNYNRGMFLITSYNNEIRGNEIYNTGEGISIGGQNTNVSNNHFHHNVVGINHYGGRFNEISGNTIEHHTSYGINIKPACYNLTITRNVIRHNAGAIIITNSDNHTVTNNRISENLAGIFLFYSVDNCFFANNTFIDNTGTGITISGHQVIPDGACENNTVEWNDFIDNTDGSISQAFEQRSNPDHPNIFDYNYWSDWTTPDVLPPFWIVDIPYDISGNAQNADPHPRTTPFSFVLRMDLKLSGEFDFLLKEDIHLQLAALLTNKETGQPISGANVTFTVYDPNGQIFLQDILREEVIGTGVYLNRTLYTMADWNVPKGIYIVIAEAQLFYHPVVMDMIQFHIDPPRISNEPFYTPLVVLSTAIGCMVILFLLRSKGLYSKNKI